MKHRNAIATAAFVAFTLGLWMERPSLALIVPGAIVFSALTFTHFRGGNGNA